MCRQLIEALESRRLLSGGLSPGIVLKGENQITINIAENQGVTFIENKADHIDVEFKHCSGTVTVTGTNLVQTTVKGGGVVVTGQLAEIDEVHVTASSDPNHADVLIDGTGFGNDDEDWTELQSFVDDVRVNDIEIHEVLLVGNVNVDQTDFFRMDDAHDARMNFAGGMSQFSSKSLLDSFITVDGSITQFNSNTFLATTPGSGSLSASSIGSINIRDDFTGDLRFTPAAGLKYTLNTFKIGGAASGTWDIPGLTNSFSAGSIGSSFTANFGAVNNFGVRLDFGGNLTAGSINSMSIGRNLELGHLEFTHPFAPNFWDLGRLRVGNSILGGTINSVGNIGSISTMITDYSTIEAGISSGYVFGNVPTMTDYTSPCIIKSFTSDCAKKSTVHFENSYVGAFELQNVLVGNALTSGAYPSGFAGARIDKLGAEILSKPIRILNATLAADITGQLTTEGQSTESLGSFRLLMPQVLVQF